MNKNKRNKILTIFLFIQVGLVFLFSKIQNFIENNYTNGIYIYVSKFLRSLFGWIPFSIGDVIYFIIILFIIRLLIKLITSKNSNRLNIIFQLVAGFSIFYFFFYFFWGLNYSRLSVTNSLEIEKNKLDSITGKYDIEKLKTLTDKLLYKVITVQSKLVENDTLAVSVPYSKKEILDLTKIGYQNLSNQFVQFKYEPSSIKKSLFSLPLTYMGFSGYFNPLTGEAQVDYLIPKISLLFTSSHEVAHQLGIASESEANFIGYLAANSHDDLYFQYAANLTALQYAFYDIYRYDPKIYETYKKQIPLGVLKNIRETQDFWKKYKNPAEPVFKYFYDNYLKYNQQKDGLQSYNKMVGLLIPYDDKYNLK